MSTAVAASNKYDDIGAPDAPPDESKLSTAEVEAVRGGVTLTASMTSREMTAAVQDALTAVNANGGGTVEVRATDGASLTLDDMLRIGSRTHLKLPDSMIVTRGSASRDIPVFSTTISGGAITAVGVSSQPGGYREAPQIYFCGSQLEPAEVYAFVDGATETVTAVKIQNGGRGYWTAPTSVVFTGTARSDVTGASLARDPVITLTVSGGAVTGATIVDAGANLAYGGWVPLRVKGGLHARATATVNSAGALTGVTVTQGGANYFTTRPYQTLGGTTKAYAVGGNPYLVAPLITNLDWHDGNADITIEGGIWDGNVDGIDYAYTSNEFNGMGMLFVGCDRLVLKPHTLQNMHRYAIHMLDCWDCDVYKHACYNGFDDVHLTGPNQWIRVHGMTGSVGDDIFTCTTLERSELDLLAGAIRWIDVRDVNPQGTSFMFAIWGGLRPDGTSYEVDGVEYSGVRGMSTNQLLRVSNVEALACSGLRNIKLTDVRLRGQETFTSGSTYTPPVRSLALVNYCAIDRLHIDVAHYLGSSGNTVTPTILEVNASGSVRHLKAKLDVDWACALLANIITFASGSGTAPETVEISGSVVCGAEGSNSLYLLNFGSGKAPTVMTDLSGLVAKRLSLVNGLLGTNNYLRAHGLQLYRANSNASGMIAYSGVMNASMVGCHFSGGHNVFVSSTAADTLNWHGSGNIMLDGCRAHQSNTANLYPRDLSLTVSLTHTTVNNHIGKAAGVMFFANGTTNYGIKNSGLCIVSPEADGTLWFQTLGDGCRAMVATIVAGGTGHAVNDLLTVTTGTWRSPPVIKVTAVSGGVVTAVTVDYAGLWDRTRPTGTLSTSSSGAGTGATFTLAPL